MGLFDIGSSDNRNWGANAEQNKALAAQSGYLGNFGSGGYQGFMAGTHDIYGNLKTQAPAPSPMPPPAPAPAPAPTQPPDRTSPEYSSYISSVTKGLYGTPTTRDSVTGEWKDQNGYVIPPEGDVGARSTSSNYHPNDPRYINTSGFGTGTYTPTQNTATPSFQQWQQTQTPKTGGQEPNPYMPPSGPSMSTNNIGPQTPNQAPQMSTSEPMQTAPTYQGPAPQASATPPAAGDTGGQSHYQQTLAQISSRMTPEQVASFQAITDPRRQQAILQMWYDPVSGIPGLADYSAQTNSQVAGNAAQQAVIDNYKAQGINVNPQNVSAPPRTTTPVTQQPTTSQPPTNQAPPRTNAPPVTQQPATQQPPVNQQPPSQQQPNRYVNGRWVDSTGKPISSNYIANNPDGSTSIYNQSTGTWEKQANQSNRDNNRVGSANPTGQQYFNPSLLEGSTTSITGAATNGFNGQNLFGMGIRGAENLPNGAPNFMELANQQSQANIGQQIGTSNLNNPNQYGPGGSRVRTLNADGSYSLVDTLSPDLQRNYDAANALKYRMLNNAQDAAGNQLSYEGASPSAQFDPSGVQGMQNLDMSGVSGIPQGDAGTLQSARDSVYSQQTQYLDPQFQRAQADLENKLANQGIMPGSEAYKRAMSEFGDTKQRAYNDARMSAIQFGGQEQSRLFGLGAEQHKLGAQDALTKFGANQDVHKTGMQDATTAFNAAMQARQQGVNEANYLHNSPINDLSALNAQTQIQLPTYQGFSGTGGANVDYVGAANLQNQANIGIANAETLRKQNQTNGLFGLGGAFLQSQMGQNLLSNIGSGIGNLFSGSNTYMPTQEEIEAYQNYLNTDYTDNPFAAFGW